MGRVATHLFAVVFLAALLDPDSQAHAQFTGALGGGFRVPPPPAVEVEELLQRRNQSVRRRGAGFLGELGDKAKAIAPTIRKALADPDPLVHVPAALWMATHAPDHPDIIPLLMKSFDGDVSELWPRVVLALKELEPERTDEVVRAIIARIEAPRPPAEELALRSGTPDLFWDAVHALTLLGQEAQPAVPALVARFEPSPGAFNGRLVSPLRDIKGPAAELALARAVKDAKDPHVRWDACEALLALGPPTRDIALAMLEVLEADTDGSIGWRSFGFKRVANAFPEVREPLVTMLEHGWARQRGRAASLLGMIGPDAKESVPVLLRACNDDEWLVRACAIDALVAITPVPSAEVLDAYVNALEDTDPRVVGSALRGIAPRSEDPEVHAAIERLMKRDSSHEVLGGIIVALKPIGVLTLAKHQDAIVRGRVLWAIGSFFKHREPSREVAAGLTPFLADTKPAVRRAALAALSVLADVSKAERMPNGQPRARPIDFHWVGEEIVPEVSKLLADPDGDVRRQAALTLTALGSQAAGAPAALSEQGSARVASGEVDRESRPEGDRQALAAQKLQDPDETLKLIATLVDGLGQARNWEQKSALRDLGQHSPLVEQSLAALFEHGDVSKRVLRDAAWVLSEVGTQASVVALMRKHLISNGTCVPSDSVRDAIIKLGPDASVVVQGLGAMDFPSDAWSYRVEPLVQVLQSIGPDVVEELVALSTSNEPRKRQISAWGLGLYGDVGQKGLDALARLSVDADRSCRLVALKSLGNVGHWPPAVVDGLLRTWFEQECPESFRDWTEEMEEYDYVPSALATCGNDAIERLIKAMETGDHRTRLLAAEALSASGCPEPLRPRLQRMAHDPGEDKRLLARQLLERLEIPLMPSIP